MQKQQQQQQQHLDPHQRPPQAIRAVYKLYQKKKTPVDLDTDEHIIHLTSASHASLPSNVHVVRELMVHDLMPVFRTFAASDMNVELQHHDSASTIAVYEHDDMPGLHIIPCLLPREVQLILLSRLLHRHLVNPAHLTNIHTHYNISYPSSNSSFFSLSPSLHNTIATPLDPTVHKPLNVAQLLNKKIRWTTLGGQYDWTAKQYPESPPPAFPSDIQDLLQAVFPNTRPQAAIVNLYSPGDTLGVHRDVAENSAHGLISLSLGCDAIFVIGTDTKVLTLRLPSGSALYMSGPSRFAWHGVPQIVAGTCPDYLKDWPGGSTDQARVFDDWKGWMAGKRVNLNVRQMWDTDE